MQGNMQRTDSRVLAKRAPTIALLLAGLLATVACGASPQPTATIGPTPIATTQPAAASRTTCVGAGCPGASPTPTVAALEAPTAAAPTASIAPTATIAATTTVARPTGGTATPGSAVLYRADFRTWFLGEEGGQYPLRTSVEPGTGEYRLALTGQEGGYANYRTIPDKQEFTDFQLDIDLLKIAGPDRGFYGVVFRVQPAVPGAQTIERYLLAISGDGFLTFNHIAADGTVVRVAPRTQTPTIETGGVPNHLTLVCKGTDFTVSVNRQQVGSYVGPTASGGTAGVYVGTVPGPAPNTIELAFSNLIISRLP